MDASIEPQAILVQQRGWPGWEVAARQMLRDEMRRRKVTYKVLSRRLEAYGIEELPDQINRKVNRQKFSAAFFLACMAAMGARNMATPKFPAACK